MLRPLRISTLAALATFLSLTPLSALPACGTKSTATPRPPPDPNAPPLLGADCDPLVPTQCGFPFPSNVYLVDDPATVTKKHVAFGKTTLPAYSLDKHSDPATFATLDGFSPGAMLMTHLPGATVTNLATPDTIALSTAPDSPTVVIDAATGEHIPHWVEIDATSTDDTLRAFMIRPAVRLKDATRYVVAIRRVVDATGAALAPTPVFQALRDGTPNDDPSVDRRRALYADILAKLAAADVPANDLQIAWDFSTASRENNTRALIHMRDDALAKVGADGPPYVISTIEENPNPHIRRRIRGTMTVPLYLDKPQAGGRLVIGPDGLPQQNGTATFDFLVHIPNSATTGTPLPLLQNGHGLLGSMVEGQNGYLAEVADTEGFVAFGVDLVGMANEDIGVVTNALAGDIGDFRMPVDRQHQGLLNSLLAMRLMKGRFAKDPNVMFNGVSAIDPTRSYYRGDSQGGIFGTTYMAISTDVTRGMLGEPGVPYGLLIPRSTDAGPFLTVVRITYNHRPMDVQILLQLVQMLWDKTEPDGYVPYITENMLPNTPAHTVLIHAALGDHQVSPYGAQIIARAVHARNINAANRPVFGLDQADAPFSGSAYVEYDFGLPPAPLENLPATAGEDPHDKLRVVPSAEEQENKFLHEGVVAQFCTGPCKGG